ncbi:MAG: queuosine precursor transporter [Defluviitaleaceae bacterium]|nr:queuosine precursor transporter [Defluviitaleaceae bacterium]
MKTENRVMSPLLMYLSITFVATLLISNVIANHMLVFIRWSIDAGTITFPITYIISDVLSEVYGYKWSRRVAWTSLAINAVFALIIIVIVRLPSPEWYEGVYFTNALANSWRIVVASLVAYCVGDLADDRVFRRLRERNRKKYDGKENMRGFAFRALASSLVGHILDTNLFVFIAFAFIVPWNELPGMIILGILIKWAYEWAIIPVTYLVTKWVHRKEDEYAKLKP